MKLSALHRLLENRLSVADFRQQVSRDMNEYLERAHIKGSVMPVPVDEDEDIAISGQHIRMLCGFFVGGQLTAEELAYIADAMELSERVQFGEGISALVAEMTDPEVNGPFTVERAKEIFRSV
jgi:hypothetical protein